MLAKPRPGPAVIVLHGSGVDSNVQRPELSALADWGLSAAGVDAPHHGARWWRALNFLRWHLS